MPLLVAILIELYLSSLIVTIAFLYIQDPYSYSSGNDNELEDAHVGRHRSLKDGLVMEQYMVFLMAMCQACCVCVLGVGWGGGVLFFFLWFFEGFILFFVRKSWMECLLD